MATSESSSENSFSVFAGIAAIVSAPLAIGSGAAMMLAVHNDFDRLNDPLIVLKTGAAGAGAWQWSFILDLLGYYLLIAPLILALRARLKASAWADLAAVSLLFYCGVGATGAAVLYMAAPSLIAAYGSADAAARPMIELLTRAFSDTIYRGLFNALEVAPAAVGWIGFGLLQRRGRPALGWLAIILGLACALDWAATIAGLEAAAMAGLSVYLVLAPVWALWSGVNLLREGRRSAA